MQDATPNTMMDSLKAHLNKIMKKMFFLNVIVYRVSQKHSNMSYALNFVLPLVGYIVISQSDKAF